MAKTESSAVNELIDLVQSGTPLGAEADDDLFAPPTSVNVQPPRMVPALRGAGEVEPLPPRRAPHATSEHAQLPPAIRMTTAPDHGDTIPPIANVRSAQSVRAVPPPRPRAS